MTVKMSSAVLCTSGTTGDGGMMTIVINHSVTSAKDVSIALVNIRYHRSDFVVAVKAYIVCM